LRCSKICIRFIILTFINKSIAQIRKNYKWITFNN